MNAWLTKVHPKTDNPHPNFKEICWYIDYLSILLPLQTAYYTKLSNFPELINHLHWYNGVRIIPPTKTPPRKTSPTENSPVENFPVQNPPQEIFLRVWMRTHFFTAVFPAINHWFGVVALETGDDFSIICNFITIFVNRVYSKFNNFSSFVLHCQ